MLRPLVEMVQMRGHNICFYAELGSGWLFCKGILISNYATISLSDQEHIGVFNYHSVTVHRNFFPRMSQIRALNKREYLMTIFLIFIETICCDLSSEPSR